MFSSGAIDLDVAEIEEVEEEEKVQAPELFRDRLQQTGGKLNHNFIKLKYERRNLPQTQTVTGSV